MRSVRAAYRDLMDSSQSERARSEKRSAEWILEYVLRHCNDDWVVKELLKALPVPNESVKLKKMILLKRISCDVSKGSISEKTLEALEAINELNQQLHQCDNDVSVSNHQNFTQELYCSVVVECTMKHLRPEINNLDDYNAALKRLWSDRIEDSEDGKMGSRVSDMLRELKKELVAVVDNSQLRDALLSKYRREEVLESLKAFLRCAWNDLGPTFLENVAEDIAKGRYNPLSRAPADVCERTAARTGLSVSQSRAVQTCTKSAVCSGGLFPNKRNDAPETERVESSNSGPMGIDKRATGKASLHTSNGCCLTVAEKDGFRKLELQASDDVSELPKHRTGLLAPQTETRRGCSNTPVDAGERFLEEIEPINNLHEKAMRENEVSRSSSLASSNGCPSLEIGVRHTDVGNSVAESLKHIGESSSTFAPPWTAINTNTKRKRMPNRLREKQVCLSETREVCVDGQNGKPLADRNVPHCQNTRINPEDNEIAGQDGPIREGDAQNSGRSNLQHLDGTNNKTRRSLRLMDSGNNKQGLTPEFIKTQEVLGKCISDLHSRVEDPLPDALQVAEDVAVKGSFHSVSHPDGKQQIENPTVEVEVNMSQKDHNGNCAEQVCTRRTACHIGKSHSEPLKGSIMDRNPTAQTYEWDEDDPIECSHGKSPSGSRRIHLPTPTTRQFSPLNRPRTVDSIQARRRHIKWSVHEEDILRKEVAKYGKGRWKFILQKNQDIFENRTEVDLKDKWRNIARREGLH